MSKAFRFEQHNPEWCRCARHPSSHMQKLLLAIFPCAQVNRELSGGTGMSPGGAYGGYYDEHEAPRFDVQLAWFCKMLVFPFSWLSQLPWPWLSRAAAWRMRKSSHSIGHHLRMPSMPRSHKLGTGMNRHVLGRALMLQILVTLRSVIGPTRTSPSIPFTVKIFLHNLQDFAKLSHSSRWQT